jgi:hypothetical protein
MGDSANILFIGVDPGLISGVAWWSRGSTIQHFVGSPMDTCTQVRDVIDQHTDLGFKTVMSVERYTMGSSTRTQQPDALKIIGVMQWFEFIIPTVKMIVNGAADAATIGSRENLTKIGWWLKADPDQHRNRASAQVAKAVIDIDPRAWHVLLGDIVS